MPVAQILPPTPAELQRLARRLQEGDVVAVPTETVYGLAAHALDPRAVRRIFRAKRRPLTDPLIVHVASLRQAETLAHWTPLARRLARGCWPGPLTLVLPRKPIVPDLVTAGRPTVALRLPAHPVMRRLLRAAGVPLAAPSANPFGYLSPTRAEHVQGSLGRRIRWILDGGPCAVGVESTILDLSNPARPTLLRAGGIPIEELTRLLGRAPLRVRRAARADRAQRAPGMLTRHYSPHTPLRLHVRLTAARLRRGAPDEAFVFFARPAAELRRLHPRVTWLTARGSAKAAARNLFARLHELEAAGLRRIHVELAPESDAGAAINDRLRRAAARG